MQQEKATPQPTASYDIEACSFPGHVDPDRLAPHPHPHAAPQPTPPYPDAPLCLSPPPPVLHPPPAPPWPGGVQNPLGPLVTVMRSGTYLGSFCSANLCAAKRPVVPLIAALGIVGGAVSLIALLWASRAHIAACSPCLAEWLDHFLPPARPRLGEVQWAEAVQAAQAAQARMSAALRPLPLLRLTVWAGSGEVCLEKLHDSMRASLEHPYQASQTGPSSQLGSTYGSSRLAQQTPPHPPPQAAALPPPPLTPAAGTPAAVDLADLATTSTARAAPSAMSSSSSSSCLGSDKGRTPGSEGSPAEGVAVGGEGPVPGTPVPPLVWGEEAGKDTAEVGGSTPVQGLVYQEAQWEFKLPGVWGLAADPRLRERPVLQLMHCTCHPSGVDALVLSPGLRALHLVRAEAPHHSGFATWSVSPPAPDTHSGHPPAQPLPDPPPPARRPLFAQLAVWTSTSRPASDPATAPSASRRSASLPPLADQPGDSRV
ncbi:hypothetical protein QJQ45_007986 [Haematococcus lacustris]|nr:hypothetical protein QJQ45_007986 [Haematococcus lacustris]